MVRIDSLLEERWVWHTLWISIFPAVYSSLFDVFMIGRQLSTNEKTFLQVSSSFAFEVLGSNSFVSELVWMLSCYGTRSALIGQRYSFPLTFVKLQLLFTR